MYLWCVSEGLIVSWWGVGDVSVTLQCLSLHCAVASWWPSGMRVQCCVCEVFFGVVVAFEYIGIVLLVVYG